MKTFDALLHDNATADVLRLSTAGSVDDGKSTLIGRMLHDSKSIYNDHLEAVGRDSKRLGREEVDLALLTDGLKAEREQGITIDVAYRYFSTPKRRFIIADTPGHEQYTRNMATGASTADLAIILIDARQGVLPQSKRHAFIASLLRIPHVVLAVNKMDLIGYDQAKYEAICDEFRAFASRLDIHDVVTIPISALKGDNVVERSTVMDWYGGKVLLDHLETVYVGADRNLVDFRFPVQYVNRPNSDFRGFCGTVASGIVRPGDAITVLPSGKSTTVNQVLLPGNVECDYAYSGQSITVTLDEELDISRGDMLVPVNNAPAVARQFEAMLVWMSENPLKQNHSYTIKHTTNLVRGQVSKLRYRVDPNELHRQETDTLHLNEIGRVSVEVFRPIAMDPYAQNRSTGAFIVIDPMTHETVAAGMIVDRRSTPASVMAQQEPVSTNIVFHESSVSASDRAEMLGQQPRTIWLTGLSGSGKSTVGYALERMLIGSGRACFVLDGDNVRHGLNRDLSFSPKDRTENIRRIAEVAKLMNDAGLIVITAFISPYREDRRAARAIIGDDRFVEVHLATPLEVCEQRDPKGLYAKARAGDIPSFSGISAPYEAPEAPEAVFDTSQVELSEIVESLVKLCHDL
jgi:bifunctional enzyme CysN/CysC